MKKYEIIIVSIMYGISAFAIFGGFMSHHFQYVIPGLFIATVAFVYVAIKEFSSLEKHEKEKAELASQLSKRVALITEKDLVIECTDIKESERLYNLFDEKVLTTYSDKGVYVKLDVLIRKILK